MENKPKKWAVLVYFAADVDDAEMCRAAESNLWQMGKIGSSDDVYLAAQIDRTGHPTRRYVLPQRPAGSPASTLPPDPSLGENNLDSADSDTIGEFFRWAIKECPAENTILAFWGHGYGIDDFIPPGTSPRDFPPFANLLVDPEPVWNKDFAGFVPDNLGLAENQLPFTFMPDLTSKSVLLNNQTGNAVRVCKRMLPQGRNLAILGFDSCEMAMAEVYAEMYDCADFAVASQAALPTSSWPYDSFLTKLLAKPEMVPEEVARTLLQSFSEFYDGQSAPYVTLSVVDLRSCKKLEESIKPLAEALAVAATDPASREAIFEARNYCPEFDPDGFIDFGCFCEFLRITLPNNQVSIACIDALSAIKEFVINSVYSPPGDGTKISQSTGLSVWFPRWIQNPTIDYIQKPQSVAYLNGGYAKTDFAKNTRWDVFLSRMLQAPATIRNLKTGGAATNATPADTRDGKKGGEGEMGKTGEMGKAGEMGGRVFGDDLSRQAGVIVRATVEAFGAAGDTELNVTVKWPAARIGTASSAPDRQAAQPLAGPATKPDGPKGITSEDHLKLPQKSPNGETS